MNIKKQFRVVSTRFDKHSNDLVAIIAACFQLVGAIVLAGSTFPVSGISVGNGLGDEVNLTAFNPDALNRGFNLLIFGFAFQIVPNVVRLMASFNPKKQ